MTTFVVTAYMEDLMLDDEEEDGMVGNGEPPDDIDDWEELLLDIARDELSGDPPITLDEFMEAFKAKLREYGCEI